jgi:uncharacterized protein (TIGR03435 family)
MWSGHRRISEAFSQPFRGFVRQSFNVQRILPMIALCSLAVTAVAGADVSTFEVASVKPSASNARGGYRPTPGDQMLVLLQGLLADRFKLAFHRETKEMSGFVLSAKTKGKPGPGMHPTECTQGPPTCGGANVNFSPAGFVLTLRGGTMAQLDSILQNRLAAPVVDETGLEGTFDLKVEFGSDINGPQAGPANDLPSALASPSLFTAIPEQLGLKLDSRRAPAQMFVIDHAERPLEN